MLNTIIITLMCALITHAPHAMTIASTTDATVTATAVHVEDVCGELFITDSVVMEFDSVSAIIDTLYTENA